MKKSVKIIKIGENQARYLVQIHGQQCSEYGPESTACKLQMIQMICDRPDIAHCGPAPFQKLKLFYGGNEWVLEVEAVADDISGEDNAPRQSREEF